MTKVGSFLFFALFLVVCGSPQSQQSETESQSNNGAEGRGQQDNGGTPKDTEAISGTTACYNTDVGERALLKSQTFAIDFEPFKGSCFITTHDREYKDPPLDCEFGIYRDGKNVFTFPQQFNGVQFGCWVEAVAFQDVNSDKRTDIIVIGKCSGKSDSFNENSIYINDGKAFFTRTDSNYELANLGTIKDVAAFAKANPVLFSPSNNASDSNRKP